MAQHSAETFFQRLRAFDNFFEPVHRDIVNWLDVPRGAHVADIGCGAAGMTLLLAEAVGAEGQTVALETSAERVDAIRHSLEKNALAPRIALHQGALPKLPFQENEFEVVWCSRVVHHVGDQVGAIRELARIAKPGGRVVLREGGIAPRFLPHDVGLGAPGIQDRLQVAQNTWFDTMRAHEEGVVPYPHGWLTAVREAGLKNVQAKSFLYERTPPFSETQTSYLRNWLHDYATHDDVPLSEPDRDTLRALCDEASERYAFRREDLHLLYVASIYIGEKE